MANKELWEIELDIKTDKVNAAQKKYDESLEKIKTTEKRLTAAILNEGKIQTATKLNELKLQEAILKSQLAKEITENKAANAKELIDYKQTLAEKNKLAKDSAAQIKAQQKIDSKFTGQSTELGSLSAITQQISYFKNLQGTVNTNSREFGVYSQKVRELNAEKKMLTGTTNGLNSALGGFMGTMVKAYGISQLYNMSLNSAKFQVMRDNFVGGEKELEAFRKASANTVTDASLIALSNQASDLNIALKDQAILFAFAEKQSDKYGTSTEEGFAKVFRIMQGNTKGLKDYGIVTSEFTALTEKLAKEQGKEVDEQIRLEAMIKLSNMTYKDAVNNTMDMADWYETLVVQTKNVADEHGNLGDMLKSINPVLGFFTIGMDDLARKETKSKEDAMLLIGSLNDFNNSVPGWGAATEELRGYFINLAETFLTTANTAGMIQNALGGTHIDRQAGDGSIPLQGTGKLKTVKTGTGSRNNSIKQEKEEELNLIKLQEAEYKKLETQLAKNLGDLGAENKLRLQMLDIEREIFKLRYGADVTFKNLPDVKGINTDNIPGLILRKGFKLKSANAGDPRPDMTSDEFKAMIDAELAKGEAMLGYASQTSDAFLNILQTTGLIDDSFMQIVNMVKSIINDGGSFISGIGNLLGFLPGGSLISGAIGTLSGGGIGTTSGGGLMYNGGTMPNIGMPNKSQKIVVQNHFHGELSAIGSYKVVKMGNNMISERGTGVI